MTSRPPTGSFFAPTLHWSDMGDASHFVQFAESDEYLVHSVGGFIGSALARGDAAVVIATATHRDAIDRALGALGLDVAAQSAAGTYVAMDAEATIERICVAGWPDEQLFRHAIGRTIGRLAAGGRRVRAFGEMVALFAAAGNPKAAIRLEELWNELAREHRFSLFCAYRLGADLDAAMLHDVCRQHAGVIPAESYASLDSPADRLRAIVDLQQRVSLLEAAARKRDR